MDPVEANNSTKNRRGNFSKAVKTSVALTVAATLAGFLAASQQPTTGGRVATAAMIQLVSIQRAIRMGLPGNEISVGALIESRLLDNPGRLVKGDRLVHVFGGEIHIAGDIGKGRSNTFLVGFREVPKEYCAKLLTQDLGRGVAYAGAGILKSRGELPFSPADAAASCDKKTNDVVWIFQGTAEGRRTD